MDSVSTTVLDEPLPKRACLSLEDTANLAPPQSQVSVTANDSECSSTDIINGQPVDNDNGAGNGPSRSDEGRKELKELSRKYREVSKKRNDLAFKVRQAKLLLSPEQCQALVLLKEGKQLPAELTASVSSTGQVSSSTATSTLPPTSCEPRVAAKPMEKIIVIDDDLMIIEKEPLLSRGNNAGGDDGVVIIDGTPAKSADNTHSREKCSVYTFRKMQSTQLGPVAANMRHCAYCVCYACGKPASQCPMWSAAHDAHCNAHSQSLGWKQARRRNDLPDPLSNPISSPIDLAALNALVPEKSKVALAAAMRKAEDLVTDILMYTRSYYTTSTDKSFVRYEEDASSAWNHETAEVWPSEACNCVCHEECTHCTFSRSYCKFYDELHSPEGCGDCADLHTTLPVHSLDGLKDYAGKFCRRLIDDDVISRPEEALYLITVFASCCFHPALWSLERDTFDFWDSPSILVQKFIMALDSKLFGIALAIPPRHSDFKDIWSFLNKAMMQCPVKNGQTCRSRKNFADAYNVVSETEEPLKSILTKPDSEVPKCALKERHGIVTARVKLFVKEKRYRDCVQYLKHTQSQGLHYIDGAEKKTMSYKALEYIVKGSEPEQALQGILDLAVYESPEASSNNATSLKTFLSELPPPVLRSLFGALEERVTIGRRCVVAKTSASPYEDLGNYYDSDQEEDSDENEKRKAEKAADMICEDEGNDRGNDEEDSREKRVEKKKDTSNEESEKTYTVNTSSIKALPEKLNKTPSPDAAGNDGGTTGADAGGGSGGGSSSSSSSSSSLCSAGNNNVKAGVFISSENSSSCTASASQCSVVSSAPSNSSIGFTVETSRPRGGLSARLGSKSSPVIDPTQRMGIAASLQPTDTPETETEKADVTPAIQQLNTAATPYPLATSPEHAVKEMTAEQLAARTTRRKFRLLALCLHTLLPQNKTLDKGNVMLMMESNIGMEFLRLQLQYIFRQKRVRPDEATEKRYQGTAATFRAAALDGNFNLLELADWQDYHLLLLYCYIPIIVECMGHYLGNAMCVAYLKHNPWIGEILAKGIAAKGRTAVEPKRSYCKAHLRDASWHDPSLPDDVYLLYPSVVEVLNFTLETSSRDAFEILSLQEWYTVVTDIKDTTIRWSLLWHLLLPGYNYGEPEYERRGSACYWICTKEPDAGEFKAAESSAGRAQQLVVLSWIHMWLFPVDYNKNNPTAFEEPFSSMCPECYEEGCKNYKKRVHLTHVITKCLPLLSELGLTGWRMVWIARFLLAPFALDTCCDLMKHLSPALRLRFNSHLYHHTLNDMYTKDWTGGHPRLGMWLMEIFIYVADCKVTAAKMVESVNLDQYVRLENQRDCLVNRVITVMTQLLKDSPGKAKRLVWVLRDWLSLCLFGTERLETPDESKEFTQGLPNPEQWCMRRVQSGTPRNAELIKLFVKAYPAMTLQLLVVKLTEIEALFLVDRVSECQRHYFPKVLGVVRAAFEEAGHLGYFAHHLKNLRAGRLRKKPALMSEINNTTSLHAKLPTAVPTCALLDEALVPPPAVSYPAVSKKNAASAWPKLSDLVDKQLHSQLHKQVKCGDKYVSVLAKKYPSFDLSSLLPSHASKLRPKAPGGVAGIGDKTILSNVGARNTSPPVPSAVSDIATQSTRGTTSIASASKRAVSPGWVMTVSSTARHSVASASMATGTATSTLAFAMNSKEVVRVTTPTSATGAKTSSAAATATASWKRKSVFTGPINKAFPSDLAYMFDIGKSDTGCSISCNIPPGFDNPLSDYLENTELLETGSVYTYRVPSGTRNPFSSLLPSSKTCSSSVVTITSTQPSKTHVSSQVRGSQATPATQGHKTLHSLTTTRHLSLLPSSKTCSSSVVTITSTQPSKTHVSSQVRGSQATPATQGHKTPHSLSTARQVSACAASGRTPSYRYPSKTVVGGAAATAAAKRALATASTTIPSRVSAVGTRTRAAVLASSNLPSRSTVSTPRVSARNAAATIVRSTPTAAATRAATIARSTPTPAATRAATIARSTPSPAAARTTTPRVSAHNAAEIIARSTPTAAATRSAAATIARSTPTTRSAAATIARSTPTAAELDAALAIARSGINAVVGNMARATSTTSPALTMPTSRLQPLNAGQPASVASSTANSATTATTLASGDGKRPGGLVSSAITVGDLYAGVSSTQASLPQIPSTPGAVPSPTSGVVAALLATAHGQVSGFLYHSDRGPQFILPQALSRDPTAIKCLEALGRGEGRLVISSTSLATLPGYRPP